ncbi:MAG TPA: hypothetical protein VFQ44_03150 [Streptosporangiaceae bacterium]|nr:hypothetical protein [Streptosporangiaceae bacterium]
MSSPSLTPDEIRAAAETHRELGPEYQSAVIESFIDKVGKEIDARVDARLGRAQHGAPAQVSRSSGRGASLALGIVSISLGIPITAIIAANHYSAVALVLVWVAIAVINIAFSHQHQHPHPHPPRRS